MSKRHVKENASGSASGAGAIAATPGVMGHKKRNEEDTIFAVSREEKGSDRIKDDPCWKGYKMVGKKNKGGKQVPNCVPESMDIGQTVTISSQFNEAISGVIVEFNGDKVDVATRTGVKSVPWNKLEEDGVDWVFEDGSVVDLEKYEIIAEKKDVKLTKKHKSEKGGLTDAGRKKYNRETGSNLKRPQPEGGSRKTSYCARSMGQKKMHNIDCQKDPDKRICKARRRWKC